MPDNLGKMLILLGITILIAGLIVSFLPKITGLPKLPGDILIKKDNFVFYFPWVTSLLVSAILSIIFYFFFKK